MSRVAKKPITIPSDVNVVVSGQCVDVKGPKGKASYCVPDVFNISNDVNTLSISTKEDRKYLRSDVPFDVLGGTVRSHLNNIVIGVSQGYEKKLDLVGIGYRGQVQGKLLNLTLGFSHPISFNIPEGVSIEMPSQTEIIIKGIDKNLVGQVAATVCDFRPVEPYKGKGIRYKDQKIILKETKKK